MALKCENCGMGAPMPKHCGRDMVELDGKLVCWMELPKDKGGMGGCGNKDGNIQKIPECKMCKIPYTVV